MGRVEGKVALITGAARGQGRSHAIRLAEEGADIIALDICAPLRSNVADGATEADLAETISEVEGRGRKAFSKVVDVRDFAALKTAVEEGVAALGRLDIVSVNAGSWTFGAVDQLTEEEWRDTLDVNLTGAWNTGRAVAPILVEQGQGGSIILTSSVLGLRGSWSMAHYSSAKHGVMGLMKSMALELAPHHIRVNTVNPGTVLTDMVTNKPTYSLFAPELTDPTPDDLRERLTPMNAIPEPWVESIDVSNAVLFLASDESRFITGINIPVDLGTLLK